MEPSAGALPQTHPLLNKRVEILISCEHGGSRIPQKYRGLFRNSKNLLRSHKGYDSGSLELARHMARNLDARLYYAEISRLLIDLNRSLGHRKLFSEITGKLPPEEKQNIREQHYDPYRTEIESFIADCINTGRVILHVSVHTFTPVLGGVKRRADVGLLYDPSRKEEKALSARWQKALAAANHRLVVRCNYPYLGKTDGLTTYFRKKFPHEQYLGIELEVNQKHPCGDKVKWQTIQTEIWKAMITVLK